MPLAQLPKLIISDVDGTLIDWTEQPTEELRQLAQWVKEYHIPLTLASGRCPMHLQHFMQELGGEFPIIVNNGGGAFFHGKLLWGHYMQPLHVKAAIQQADALDMAIILCDGIRETAYRHNAYLQNQLDRFDRKYTFFCPTETQWPTLTLQKILITDPQRPGRIGEVLELLKPFEDQLSIVRYDDRSADIMPAGCTKCSAVLRLIGELGIAPQEVMAIGDAKNDIEMLSMVGTGVAVANACEELKACADYVCEKSYVSGVLEAIERFYIHQLPNA